MFKFEISDRSMIKTHKILGKETELELNYLSYSLNRNEQDTLQQICENHPFNQKFSEDQQEIVFFAHKFKQHIKEKKELSSLVKKIKQLTESSVKKKKTH
jgi:hypothetical protein